MDMGEGVTVLYPLGVGSKWLNNELRHSLRSLEFVEDLAGVVVCGDNPGFLSKNVHFIPNPVSYANPAVGIYSNILTACLHPETPEKMVLLNDDYFFCDAVNLASYPNYYIGSIQESLPRCSALYYPHLFETQEELKKKGFATFNFDVHYPLLIEKSKVIELSRMYEMFDRQHGLTFKSLYCNTFNVDATQRNDCKVQQGYDLGWWLRYVKGREVFSVSDVALEVGEGAAFIQTAYRKKSKYEI